PHNGETNARLVAHLPLIVPDGCWLRVGYERHEWKVGEIVVFDDTLEHEAMNGSDELRIVLIFDVWNPLLAVAERDMVRAMPAAVGDSTCSSPRVRDAKPVGPDARSRRSGCCRPASWRGEHGAASLRADRRERTSQCRCDDRVGARVPGTGRGGSDAGRDR